MSEYIEDIKKFLQEKDLSYSNEGDSFFLPFTGRKINFTVTLLISNFYIIASPFLPTKVPADKRINICEFISRINSQFGTGAFNFDWDEEVVSFRCMTIINRDTGIDPNSIDDLINLSIHMMDNYADGFMQIIYGSKSPIETAQLLFQEIMKAHE